jgi:hypothetical protein
VTVMCVLCRSASGTESDESEDEEAEQLTSNLDLEIMRTINAIRKKVRELCDAVRQTCPLALSLCVFKFRREVCTRHQRHTQEGEHLLCQYRAVLE